MTKGEFSESLVKDHVVRLDINASSSAHNCVCRVDGGNTMATISVLLLLLLYDPLFA